MQGGFNFHGADLGEFHSGFKDGYFKFIFANTRLQLLARVIRNNEQKLITMSTVYPFLE